MIAAHGPLWAQWYMLGRREPSGHFTVAVEGNSLVALLGHAPLATRPNRIAPAPPSQIQR